SYHLSLHDALPICMNSKRNTLYTAIRILHSQRISMVYSVSTRGASRSRKVNGKRATVYSIPKKIRCSITTERMKSLKKSTCWIYKERRGDNEMLFPFFIL